MTDRLVQRVCDWNYVRDNVQYDEELEYSMLSEELEEYGVARDLVDHADALADIIFVAVGSLYKITHSAEAVKEILDIVCTANDAKGTKKNDAGKVTKPEDFIGPELAIEGILRKC